MRYVVEKSYIENNAELVKKIVGDTLIIGAVKANGYGLDTVKFAKELIKNGITFLSVARLEEALKIREAGIDCPILMMSQVATESEANTLIENNIIGCVGSYESAVLLNSAAERHSVKLPVHVKLDTGFGRYGFQPGEEQEILKIYKNMTSLKIEGCFTHFSNSFGADASSVNRQVKKYNEAVKILEDSGMDCGMKHIANTSAALRFPETRLDAVRIGSAFLGRLSFKDTWGFQKVGHMECEITSVKRLPKDANIGYADVYRAPHDMTAAVVPVGHIDGFGLTKTNDLCSFKDKLRYLVHAIKDFFRDTRIYASVNGKKIPLAGRVGLANVVFDVTGVDCRPGDIVTLEVNPLMVDSAVNRDYV